MSRFVVRIRIFLLGVLFTLGGWEAFAVAQDGGPEEKASFEATTHSTNEVHENAPPPQAPYLHIPDEAINKMSSDQLGDIYRQLLKKPQSVAELIFQESIIIPVVLFGTFGAVAFFFAYFSYRKRKDLIHTVQSALQNGQVLPESVLEALERKRIPRTNADLRKAVLLIALGASVCVIVLVVGDQTTARKMAALGILPFLLGCAYLLLWRFDPERSRRD